MQRTVQYWRLIHPDGTPLDGKFPAQQVVRRLRAAEADNINRYRRCRDGMLLLAQSGAEPNNRMIILDKVRRENREGDPFDGPVVMRLGVGGSWSTVGRTRLG